MHAIRKKTFKYAFLKSLPVMAGYLVLGAGFGILLQSNGYSIWLALIMSATIYAGSMQYVAVDLLTGGASLIVAAMMTLMINLRHIFYGITMLDKYRNIGKAKPYLIFALTDETFSLVCAPNLPENIDEKKYYLFLSMLNQSYWIIGSFVGALIGQTIAFNTAGVEFSMTALFVVIFIEQWESTKQHLPALGGLGISLICLLIFGASDFLIPAMLGITIFLFAARKYLEKKEG